MLFIGDYSGVIRQYKIKDDGLKELISQKNNTHNNYINNLLNMGNGFIASCSNDNTIKIW